jgi:transcriptional regulator with XRE-family HTH domain
MIVVSQLRAARGILGWSQSDLSKASGVALSTVKRMEAGSGLLRGIAQNVWKVQSSLEDAGVVFIDENGGGAGVRMRQPA